MGLAAVLVGYRTCRVLVRLAHPVFSPIGRLGRHSLDCYVILSVTVLVLPDFYRYQPTGIAAVGVAFDILVAMFGWCLLRDWLAPACRRRHQLASARDRADRDRHQRA
jgi:hypothetical protein